MVRVLGWRGDRGAAAVGQKRLHCKGSAALQHRTGDVDRSRQRSRRDVDIGAAGYGFGAASCPES